MERGKMKKTIIVYYSYEGNTKKIAEAMADHIQVDLMAIKPKKERRSKGLGKYFWGGYEALSGKSPELEPFEKDLGAYEVIILGTPVWAGTYSPPLNTLLEGDFLNKKKIAFFCSHDGGPGKVINKAREAIEKKNTLITAKDFSRPKKDMDSCISQALIWADEILKSLE